MTHTGSLDQLASFSNLDSADLAGALDSVVSFLSQLDKFGFLNEKIPLVKKSLSELVSLTSRFQTLADNYRSQPAQTLVQLKSTLQTILGVPFRSLPTVMH